MPDLKNVKEYIRALEHVTHFLRQILDEEKRVIPPPATEIERLTELTDLRLLTKSEFWPAAIDPDLIGDADNEGDKVDRAEGILRDFVKLDLTNKRFLDYGCGEGHVARQAVEMGTSLSIGYDIMEKNWDKLPMIPNRFALKTDLPDNEFDVILLNDVLDHAEDPLAVLRHVMLSKKVDALVFVRCHPFTSRHGTHLFQKVNKAYLHLVFTEAELMAMGLKGDKVNKILDPIPTYKRWFAETGFKVIGESTIAQPVDAFFTTRPAIIRRIKDNWKVSADPEFMAGIKFPHEAMQLQFADFVLV